MKQADLSLRHIARAPKPGIDGKPPLILLLHGIGSNEEDLFALAPALPPQCLVVSLRSRLALGPGSYAWYHADLGRMEIDPQEEADSRRSILQFIDESVEAYGADPKRVILMGFSQGAIMSLGIMLTQPEKISAVAAMSGRLLEEVKSLAVSPERLDGFPVMVTHGVADDVIPVKLARETLDYLRRLPVKLLYREYAMAHGISQESLSDTLEWLDTHIGS